jgi:hypothetical protein
MASGVIRGNETPGRARRSEAIGFADGLTVPFRNMPTSKDTARNSRELIMSKQFERKFFPRQHRNLKYTIT